MINQLVKGIKEKDAPIVVGLDPMLSYVPKHLVKDAFAAYGETLEGENGIARRACGMQCRPLFFSLRACVKAPECGGSPRLRRCGRCPL